MKKILIILTILLLLVLGLFLISTEKEEQYYIKNVKFNADATIEEKVDIASRLIPTPQQLEWQKLELTAFLHFGINTFTNREWGNGQEDPAIFNPTAFNADQWAVTLKNAGFKMAIITAKHHDGFCLWPTETTNHSVKYSPWKEGKGDVVKEVKEACDRHGIKFGIYLSPWDRNADSYGDSPRYNQFFISQLTELLSNYGEIHEVWFDGANGEGPNGKKQIYDWLAFYAVIHQLQPNAVTAIKGDDIRWVGNESGLGRETEWSSTVLTPSAYNRAYIQNNNLGINSQSDDLGSRQILAKATEIFWYPSEVDVSIRPGWFYHPEENDKVKHVDELADIYFRSVGYNSVLLLNIPPDTRGLIHEDDVKQLQAFADFRNKLFENNCLKNNEIDWKAKSGASKTFNLMEGSTINTILLQEDISKGQRVESFTCEAFIGKEWVEIFTGSTIGYKRLCKFGDCKPTKIRLTINQSRNKANIISIGAFYAPQLVAGNKEKLLGGFNNEGWTVISPTADAQVILNNNTDTGWTSHDFSPLIIDLGKVADIMGFVYAPEADKNKEGTIIKYNFSISEDAKVWKQCKSAAEFSNIENNPIPQYVRFDKKYKAKYIKLEPLSTTSNRSYYNISGIGVFSD